MLLSQRIGKRIEITPLEGDRLRLSAQIPQLRATCRAARPDLRES